MVNAGLNRITTAVAVIVVFAMSIFTFFASSSSPFASFLQDSCSGATAFEDTIKVLIIVLGSRLSAQPVLIACASLLGCSSWCTRALDQSQRRPLEVHIAEAGFVQKWLCKNAKVKLDGILIEHFLKISLLVLLIISSCFVRPIWTIWSCRCFYA